MDGYMAGCSTNGVGIANASPCRATTTRSRDMYLRILWATCRSKNFSPYPGLIFPWRSRSKTCLTRSIFRCWLVPCHAWISRFSSTYAPSGVKKDNSAAAGLLVAVNHCKHFCIWIPPPFVYNLFAGTGIIEISSTLSAITTQYSGFRRQILLILYFEKIENLYSKQRKGQCPIHGK